jgi:sulfide:quinone oxidoreductase
MAVAPEAYEPVLRGLLLTGGRPLYLRSPQVEHRFGPAGDAGQVEPWWPAHKIVGAHLAPYLATHADLLIPVEPR